jgi:hypothetical protein
MEIGGRSRRRTGDGPANRPTLRGSCSALAAATVLAVFAAPSLAQHVSYWAGQGGGFFLAGGSGGRDPDSHSLGVFAVSLFGDRIRLRYMRGSLERDEGYQLAFGDNDVDYHAGDVVITRRVTHLPFDLAVGEARFEEGYLRADGTKTFVHHWGPHVSALRSFPIWKALVAWGECDVHEMPYTPRQVAVFLDVGLGLQF